MSSAASFHFDNTYARLPERFFARLNPTPVTAPQLIKLNVKLAEELGIDTKELSTSAGIEVLAGNRIASGSEPLAQAYAGHQFGHFVPTLGDGRTNLLGEVVASDGKRYDIQLKGSGPTPFSRRGDGRAAVGPVLREYLVSEAMAAMGVPTTRALAAVTTGQPVMREAMLRGAVLTRVAASHIRVGTFQYFAARGDLEGLRILADFAIARHYPEARSSAKPYRALLGGVIERQAKLIARWMTIGFIHGVMNTDNMSISGETIDFGPCAFMEAYDPATVFSSIDQRGRYSYSNQPLAAHWNLTRLAEAILPLLKQESGNDEAALASANEALATFEPQFEAARTAGFGCKLGLFTEREGDFALAEALLELMANSGADFTLTFRRLCDAAASHDADPQVCSLFSDPASYDAWAGRWRSRLRMEPMTGESLAQAMRQINPVFIPRNHLVQAAVEAAENRQDYQPFEMLLKVISRPFEDTPKFETFAKPATPTERVLHTFCGT